MKIALYLLLIAAAASVSFAVKDQPPDDYEEDKEYYGDYYDYDYTDADAQDYDEGLYEEDYEQDKEHLIYMDYDEEDAPEDDEDYAVGSGDDDQVIGCL